jgi:ribosomal protein S18 acetylase RimI-like enzyme
MNLEIRQVMPSDDLEELGRIVLASYVALPGHPAEPDYELELADVAARIESNRVFGAFESNVPLGCVTFVSGASEPHAEDLRPDEASFRMLGVSPKAQGRGVGTALVRECLQAGEEAGKRSVFIYSGEWMKTAHRMYDRLGFDRVPDRDWVLERPPITLLAFSRRLGEDA